ncbi:MAG: 2OG-Fe(II) oxygenase [Hymenobacter sp.]|nr:MAG: 2OG-Fe(II) oxygenase [Hymenobacter sp.]
MRTASPIDFSIRQFATSPFPHFCSTAVFLPTLERSLFEWLHSTSTWELTKTTFYEQYEFSLLHSTLPVELQCLVDEKSLAMITAEMEIAFQVANLALVGVTVHKLTDGQRIGVHNDFIGKEESHRLIVQINSGWTEDHGGYLLLFNSSNAEDVSELILPVSNSAFGFEISAVSHHAVSTVYDFARYTLVYTFNKQAD